MSVLRIRRLLHRFCSYTRLKMFSASMEMRRTPPANTSPFLDGHSPNFPSVMHKMAILLKVALILFCS